MCLPTTEPATDAFLAAFETCTLPPSEFTHSAHIFTGACFVHAQGESAATTRMRESIRRFNVAAGGQNTATAGYHETITVAWIKLLAALHVTAPGLARTRFAHHAIACFTPRRDLFARYYSFDLVQSTEARQHWIEPDLAPLTQLPEDLPPLPLLH